MHCWIKARMTNLSYCEVCYLFTSLSSNNIAMLYFMSFAKEAIAYLTRKKSSLHLASQVVGRMGKPAQNYQAPLSYTGKHVRCDSICGCSSMAVNLFQISACYLYNRSSWFLPCFTIRQWSKWHFPHRMQLMYPGFLIAEGTKEKQV